MSQRVGLYSTLAFGPPHPLTHQNSIVTKSIIKELPARHSSLGLPTVEIRVKPKIQKIADTAAFCGR